MRISDAAMLKTSSVDGNRVFLYMQKTGVPVYVPVPEILTSLLNAIKPVGRVLRGRDFDSRDPIDRRSERGDGAPGMERS